MPDKTETISVRVTEKKRKEINEWAMEHGQTEADAIRVMIERTLYDQQRLDEIAKDDQLRQKLDELETEIKQLDRAWWKRLFS